MVMVDAPPPRSFSGTVSMWSFWNRRFVRPTALPQMLCPCNPLCWPTFQVSFSLKFSPLKSRFASSTGHLDKHTLWGALCRAGRRHPGCRLHQPKPLPGVPCIFYTWEFPRSVGNKDPSGNAALTHPLCACTKIFNPGLFSQRHLESSSGESDFKYQQEYMVFPPCPRVIDSRTPMSIIIHRNSNPYIK